MPSLFTIIKTFLPPKERESTSFHNIDYAKSLKLKPSFWKEEHQHNVEAIFRKWWPNTKASPEWRNITSPPSEIKFTLENFKTLKKVGKRIISQCRIFTLNWGKLKKYRFKLNRSQHHKPSVQPAKEEKKANNLIYLNTFLINWTQWSLCQPEVKMKFLENLWWCGCQETIS